MSTMQGRRIANWFEGIREPGDYGLVYYSVERGHHTWDPDDADVRELWIIDPLGRPGRIVTHTITEEPDGTITVQPSIAPAPDDPPGSFHGWLTKGVWTW